jgi:hypothetical protein
MRGAERVVHVNVAERSHFPGQGLVVFLLPGIEAAILEEHDLPGLDFDAVQPLALQGHVHAEECGEVFRDRRERLLLVEYAFLRPS